MMAGAGVAVLAVAGLGVLSLRGGGSQSVANAAQVSTQPNPDSAATVAALGPQQTPAEANAAAPNVTGNSTASPTQAAQQASDQTNATEALRSEKAKTAAAEAQLSALKKAQAKAARAEALPPPAAPPLTKAEKKAAAAQTASSSSSSGVSAGKLSQFNSIVDDGRSMAKQAMRSSNAQNVQLAKNYDQYLKTLKDSIRGVQSDKEADKLIKQASQTRAYIQYLIRQQ